MASTDGKSDAALIAELAAEPWRFSFFRAVQLLERVATHAVPVGELGPAKREAIRFVHDMNLIFHTSDVVQIRPRVIRDGVPFAEVTSAFLGLYGTVSPLASFVSEDIIDAERAEETSLKAFYDVFHHRIMSLFYRGWKKYRFHAGFRTDASDPFTRRALSFVGVDPTAMPTEGLPALHLLALGPLLAIRTRPQRSLQIVLERVFPDIPVHLKAFVARRVVLRDDQTCKLGLQNSRLGVDCTIGRAVVDRSGRFRVGLGPLSYEMFEGLMPGGRHHPTLRKIINQFSRGVLEIECELVLDHTDAPRFQLGAERGSRLGVTTTLRPHKEMKPMRARFVMSEEAEQARPNIIDDDRNPESSAS
jgi:type VI secretion system protein ImpH